MRCPPILLTSPIDPGRKLPGIEAKPHGDTTEDWLQRLLYQHAELLPVEEFDDSLAPAIGVARELYTERGPIDLLYVSPSGGLILVETKLWKNPEKHRVVVAQLIDYAKELVNWDYDRLCEAVLAASRRQGEKEPIGLEDRVWPHPEKNASDLAEFQENVAENLRSGRYLLLIVGDRISPNIALMTNAIQSAPGLNFTFGLVEMKIYSQSEAADWPLIIVPDIVGRTVEKIRGVVQIQYKQEPPTVEVHVVDEGEKAIQGLFVATLFLDSVPKVFRSIYESKIKEWGGLGGTLKPATQTLFWEMELAGKARTIIRTTREKMYLVRRSDFEQWSSKPSLYEDYIKRLSPRASQIVHAGQVVLSHSQATPKDVGVALEAGIWLAEAVRGEEQRDDSHA